MPLTTLDPTTALLVVDLQEGLADLPTLQPVSDVAVQAGRLAATFRQHQLPVVLITANGVAPGRTEQGGPPVTDLPDGFADLLPELDPHETDHVLTKQRWGAFHDTELFHHLSALGVTQVVIGGVATSVGVESTARDAYDHGFHVVVAADAVTDIDSAAQNNSLTRIFPRLGEVATTDEIVARLTASGEDIRR